MSTAKAESLLLSFRNDTKNSVSRKTVKNLAVFLGYSTETQLIHYALSKLANEVLPAYEPDDGDLSNQQIRDIRNTIAQDKKSAISSLF